MNKFTAKTFHLPILQGISQKTIENHLALYNKYVDNCNEILEAIDNTAKPNPIVDYLKNFSFNYDGMRNHEVYFSLLEGGPKPLPEESAFGKAVAEKCGSFLNWLDEMKDVAEIGGIGWAITYCDQETHELLIAWVGEQHVGQLQCACPMVAIDMWEHAYLMDVDSADKRQYIQNFINNINWEVVSSHYDEATKS